MAIVLTGVLLSLGVFLVKMVYNGETTVALLVQREKAYWLARAGLAEGRARLAKNPDWWGEVTGELGEGGYRVTRDPGGSKISATGYRGKAVYTLEGAVK